MKYAVWQYSYSISLSLFFLLSFQTFAQDETDVIPPSPEVSALMKFSEIPVNYYTGVPNISIPLYTIQEGDISAPIILAYHASGIRVNEEASWVGLGWALQAGGVISRTVVGTDDLEDTYLEDPNLPNINTVASNTNSPYIFGGCDVVVQGVDLCDYLARFTTDSNIPIPYDFEPDQFNFSFPGGQGKFILRRDGTALLEKQDKLSIVYQATTNSWEIKDARGFIYRYQDDETVTESGGFTQVSTAWHLNEIESPRGYKVTFNYTPDTQEHRFRIGDIVETRSVSYCAPDAADIALPLPRTYQTATLTSIDFSNGQVRFDYSTDRIDQPNGRKLNAVELYEKNVNGTLAAQATKQFDFTYEYFQGNADNANFYQYITDQRQITHRLKLLSVQESASGESKAPYEFTYYEAGDLGQQTTTLPGKASFAQDYWGYYNGRSSTHIAPKMNMVVDFGNNIFRNVTLEGQDRSVVPEASKAFTLKEMTYPTGGSSEFVYESNDYDLSSSQPIENAMCPSNSPVQLLPHDEPVNAIQGQTPVIQPLDLTNAYVNPGDGKVHVIANFTFRCTSYQNGCKELIDNNTINNRDAYFELHRNSSATDPVTDPGSVVDFTDATFCYNENLQCERGPFELLLDPVVYYVKAQWNSNVDLMGMNAIYSWQTEDEDPITETTGDGLAGGLRIAQITHQPATGASIVRKYEYNYFEDQDNDGTEEKYSFGRLMDFPYHYRYQVDIDYNLWKQGQSEFCPSLVQSSTSNTVLGVHGFVVGYDQVTEYIESIEDQGKTVYEFQNSIQTVPYAESRLPGIPNAVASSNGLLKKQTDYQYVSPNVYRKVREIENDYQFVELDFSSPPTVISNSELIYGIKKRIVGFETYPCDPFDPSCPPPLPLPGMVELFFYPAIHSEWIRYNEQTIRIYHQDTETLFSESSTVYTYETTPDHYQIESMTVVDSEGRSHTTQYDYAADYPVNTNGRDLLRQNHMHSQVMEEIKTVNNIETQRVITTYSNQSGHVLPASQIVYPKGGFNGTETSIVTTYTYDSGTKGNLRYRKRGEEASEVFVWGYNDRYPIAQVTNAEINEVFFENFEEDDQNTSMDARSGRLSHSGTYTVDRPAPAGTYQLTYWYKPANGDWTFESREITSVTEDIGAATDLIDDVRVYPLDALMTTFTYHPIYGLSSISDPSNLLTSFTYDDLGRLRVTRDHRGNIRQKYEYHYGQ